METTILGTFVRIYSGEPPTPPCQIQATIALATNSSAIESVPFDVLVDLRPPTPAVLVMKGDFNGHEIATIFPGWLGL